jgi:hypothetical protein
MAFFIFSETPCLQSPLSEFNAVIFMHGTPFYASLPLADLYLYIHSVSLQGQYKERK